jgi:hypothetical protein
LSERPTTFDWEPQAEVIPSDLTEDENLDGKYVAKINLIDLRIFGADVFDWKFADNSDFELNSVDGNFVLPDSLNGKTIYCVMINDQGIFNENDTLKTVQFEVDFPVSVAEKNQANFVNIYPNPIKNEATIDFDFENTAAFDFNNLDITLYNSTGKNLGTLYSGTFMSKLNLNFANYSSGVYYLFIKMNDKQAIKFINITK